MPQKQFDLFGRVVISSSFQQVSIRGFLHPVAQCSRAYSAELRNFVRIACLIRYFFLWLHIQP